MFANPHPGRNTDSNPAAPQEQQLRASRSADYHDFNRIGHGVPGFKEHF